MIRCALSLSFARQRRNKVSFFCQALALSAIMIPLLIILGVKYGFISSLKEELLRNPGSLEITLLEGTDVNAERLAVWKSWPETAFAIPCPGVLYSSVNFMQPAENGEAATEITAELIPSASGDPVMEKLGLPVPGAGEIVLTDSLARKLGAAVGQRVMMRAWRNARKENMDMEFKVAGIIPKDYDTRKAAYAAFDVATQVEEFLINGAGSPGMPVGVYGNVYQALLLEGADDAELAEVAAMLERNSPFAKAGRAGADFLPEAGDGTWLVGHPSVAMSAAEVKLMQGLLMGRGKVTATPWVSPVSAVLQGFSLSFPVSIVSKLKMQGGADICEAPPQVLLPVGSCRPGEVVEIKIPNKEGESSLACIAAVSPDVPPGQVWATPQFAAIAKKASRQLVLWDYRSGALRTPVLHFCSARVYARSLEDTEPLLKRMQADGVRSRANLAVIRQTLALEEGLDKLFLIIASGAVLGALVSFSMSLFNAAELYRRDYALVQMLGANRFTLPIIPVADAVATVLVSLLIAFVAFYGATQAVQHIFSVPGKSVSLCRLEFGHYIGFSTVCIGVALLSSLAAAVKVLRISPAEIIRQS